MRVRQRRRFMYGLIGLRLLVVDTPARPIGAAERDRLVALTLDATRLLRKLGNDWARSRVPQVTHEICRFSISWEKHTVTPALPAPPKTGQVDLDIPAQELSWSGSLLAQLGLGAPLTVDPDDHRAVLADQTDGMLETAFFGRTPVDLVTVVVTSLPMGWFAYASAKEPVVMLQLDDMHGQLTSIDRLMAHEIAHTFGALDEYVDPAQQFTCQPTRLGGVLQVPNANCIAGGSTNQPCLMQSNQPVLCSSTPVHLGWTDSNGDQVMDLATPPFITGMLQPATHDPRQVLITGPGMQFATRVRFNDTDFATDAFIDSTPGVAARVPDHLHGPITVDVQTVTGWTRGDPAIASVIVP